MSEKPSKLPDGHLVLDLDAKGGPKFAKVGGKPDGGSTKQERDILEKVGIKPSKQKKEKPMKAAKSKKAPKAKKEPKEVKVQKIKVLVKENPKREGTSAHKMFGLYSKCKTTDEFLAKGGTTSCLRHDAMKKYIQLS